MVYAGKEARHDGDISYGETPGEQNGGQRAVGGERGENGERRENGERGERGENGENGLRQALLLTAALQLGCVSLAVLYLLKWHHGSPGPLGAILVLAAFFGLQLFHTTPYALPVRTRVGRYTLCAQAALAYAPVPMFGVLWGGLGGFLSGSLLVVLRGSLLAWVLYCLNTTAVLLLALSRSAVAEAAFLSLAGAVIGLMVHGLSRLSALVVEQHGLRERTARAAVAGERLRFSRDLHDLLGYTLNAITLKTKVSLRQVGVDDDRARGELVETLDIARQALADIRAAAQGYREISLAGELRSVGAVLETAGVRATLAPAPPGLAPRTGTVLAVVLRETVTNLLRHSAARRCRIVFGQDAERVWLEISNDGAGPSRRAREGAAPIADCGPHGSGLGNLADRLAAVGGELTSGLEGDWFRVRASCPSGHAAPAAPRHSRPGAHAGEEAGEEAGQAYGRVG